MKGRYVNPFTDLGFKKLFGTEVNKDLLIDFLNTLIYDQGRIVDLTYLKSERLGESVDMRRAIFDVYCENELGEKFIVEMQKAPQKFFKDRSVFYSTFPIRDQAPKGVWNFELKAVYTIGILNFSFPESKDDEVIHHEVKLVDVSNGKVFYDKLTYIYLELPKFTKTEEELTSNFDKWLYLLKYLPDLERRPAALQERVFERAFKIAEVARFTKAERDEYEEVMKVYSDWNNIIDFAEYMAEKRGEERGEERGVKRGEAIGEARGEARGEAIGEARGMAMGEKSGFQKAMEKVAQEKLEQEIKLRVEKLDVARKMKADGLPISMIVKYIGLLEEDVIEL